VTVDPWKLSGLNQTGQEVYFPCGEVTAPVLQRDKSTKSGFTEIAMNPCKNNGYYYISIPKSSGSGRTAVAVHRASWALNGGVNETGLHIDQVWDRTDVTVDHIDGRKSLHAGHYKLPVLLQ